MKNAGINKLTLDSVQGLVSEMQAESQSGLSTEENLRAALAKRVQDIDVNQTVEDVCSGIQAFYEKNYAASLRGFDALADDALGEMLAGRSEAQQTRLLKSILSACAQSSGALLPDFPEETADISVLKAQIKEYIAQYSLLQTDCEAVCDLLNQMGNAALEKLRDADERLRLQQYTALAIYIRNRERNIPNMDVNLTAREIGVATAGAFESVAVMLEQAMGKIDWDSTIIKLKRIAGVIALLALGAVAAPLVVWTAAIVYDFALVVTGIGLVSVIVAGIYAFYAAKAAARPVMDIGAKVAQASELTELLQERYRWLEEWLKTTLKPLIKPFWERVTAAWNALLNKTPEAQSIREDEGVQAEAEETDFAERMRNAQEEASQTAYEAEEAAFAKRMRSVQEESQTAYEPEKAALAEPVDAQESNFYEETSFA